MSSLLKTTLQKFFHLASAKLIKTVDFRKNPGDVLLIEGPLQHSISFDTIHPGHFDYYWFQFKKIDLDPLFYVKLERASIVGNGIVLNKAGHVMLESTIFQQEYFLKLRQNHLVLKSFMQRKQHVPGEVISLSNALEDNYFHWVMESLTRILLIQPKINLSKTTIVLNQSNLPFKEESLFFLFDIDSDNIIRKPSKVAFSCSAVIPSFPHTRTVQTHMTDITNPSIIRLLNKKVSDLSTKLIVGQPKYFFLSRRQSNSRRVLNEEYLLQMISHPEIKVLETDAMSFIEQVSLFFNAKLVISTHGAGLTNIIFCKDTRIVELFPQDRNVRDAFAFTQISAALNLHHHIISYRSANEHQDLEVDAELVEKINSIIHLL